MKGLCNCDRRCILALMLVCWLLHSSANGQESSSFEPVGDETTPANWNWLGAILRILLSFLQFPCGLFPPYRCGFLNLGIVLHKNGLEDGSGGCVEICSFSAGLSVPEYQCGPCQQQIPPPTPGTPPTATPPTAAPPTPLVPPTATPPLTPPTATPPTPLIPPTSTPPLTPPTAPPPPPIPTPPPTPSTCQSSTPATLEEGNSLYSDREPHYLCSSNQLYRFGLSPDDNDLALWERRESAGGGYYIKVWSSFLFENTAANSAVGGLRLILQDDGNLVVRRNSDLRAVWSSQSAGSPLSSRNTLSIGDVGKAVLNRVDGITSAVQITWQSFRCGAWGARSDAEPIVENVVDATTVRGKIMAGYQGYFDTACSDRGRWSKWSSGGQIPNRNNYQVEMWPDMSEFTADANVCSTDFQYRNGTRAGLFSSLDRATVDRHFRWMYQYGMDGVYLQRFFTTDRCFSTAVLDEVRRGAERYGRTFAYMFDVSDANNFTVYQQIQDEWKFLVDNQRITQSSRYLHHNGKPVLAIWGFGLPGRPGTPAAVEFLLRWFQSEAEERYQATIMGGVAANSWQTNTEWYNVYRMFDIVSPWSVGRYRDNGGADAYRTNYLVPNLQECTQLGIDLMPVVWPGFSWSYRKNNNATGNYPFNEIPRRGGTFLWRQLYNSISVFPSPNQAQLYVAMFDEVNEGTAVFKVTATQEETPVSIDGTANIFLALDADAPTYSNVPSDWYLRLLGTATTLVRQNEQLSSTMPFNPIGPRNLVVLNNVSEEEQQASGKSPTDDFLAGMHDQRE